MSAVERLGRYISRGVYTVSGPFHPFGGAIDIIVVQQQDGSYKSSPWYVRFGKFQGVLKSKEKVVNVIVNGEEANFHMFLDHKGEAFFLREPEANEGEPALYPSSSSDETDGQTQDAGTKLKSKSCNFDNKSDNIVSQINEDTGKVLARTSSKRSRLLGLVFGRRSMNESLYRKEGIASGVDRVDSLERAEIAANLLEVRWSTHLCTRKNGKHSRHAFDVGNGKADCGKQSDEIESLVNLPVQGNAEEITRYGIAQDDGSPLSETGEEVSRTRVKEEVITVDDKLLGGLCDSISDSSIENDEGVTAGSINLMAVRSELANATLGMVCSTEFEQLTEVNTIKTDVVERVMCSERSESSIMATDCSKELSAHDILPLGGEREGEVLVHPQEATIEILPQDNIIGRILEDIASEAQMEDSNSPSKKEDSCHSCIHEISSADQSTLREPSHAIVAAEMLNSIEEVKPQSICAISSFLTAFEYGRGMNHEDIRSRIPASLESVIDKVLTKETSTTSSSCSDEDQFPMSDLDLLKRDDVQWLESHDIDYIDEKNNPYNCESAFEEVNSTAPGNSESSSSPERHVDETSLTDLQNLAAKSTSPVTIPRTEKTGVNDVGWKGLSLPSQGSFSNNTVAADIHRPVSHSLDLDSRSVAWKNLTKDETSSSSDGDIEHQLAENESKLEEARVTRELESTDAKAAVGDSLKQTGSPNGSWRIWPFSFRRSRSRKGLQQVLNVQNSEAETLAQEEKNNFDRDLNITTEKVENQKERAITPTSEQLASLNLKEGRNHVTFVFSTSVLGKQQVDARIYLWKWNTRIVISDVDGTITKSDVLGQFMPLVGIDWSQTGVTNLFSAIKENGYQLLFLSARAISQAYHTRQFLFNLKQDGKALPEGPVVISPDGLFPSLYREVIRRAPHEFKIACLERIRDLFPSDSNPFYAGFGNRDTDEISYLKVGIPRGKIFIINPKGEVAVNRRVDTKSYHSLHGLVHGMFPAMASHEQASHEQEDYNSWNYWKLPPPDLDI